MSVYQDGLGAVWLGTSEGLCRYNGGDMRVFHASSDGQGLTNDEISNLCGNKAGLMYIKAGTNLVRFNTNKEEFTCLRRKDVLGIYCQGDTLWVSCNQGDIYYYTEQSGQFTLFAHLPSDFGLGGPIYADEDTVWVATFNRLVAIPRQEPDRLESILPFYRGQCITKDRNGNLWAGAWSGLYRLSPQRTITHYTATQEKSEEGSLARLSDNQVRCVQEDDQGQLWIGTFRGLDCYNPYTEEWTRYDAYGTSPNKLSHNSILTLHKDLRGNLWVGTYFGGVNVFAPDNDNIQMYYAEPQQAGCLNFPVVGPMTKDGAGNLWIGTEGGGLNCLRADRQTFSHLMHKADDAQSIGSDNIKCVFYRKENNTLYAGTHLGGLFVLNLTSGKGHTLRHEEGNATSLPHNIVSDICRYKNGLALLTQHGPTYFDPTTETCSPLTTDAAIQRVLHREFAYETFLLDSRQRLWLSRPWGGLVRVDLLSSKLLHFEPAYGDSSVVSKAKVMNILEDSQGDIYFCTRGEGLLKYEERTGSFVAYDKAGQALPSDYCYAACRSNDDRKIYIIHSDGLSLFNTKTGRTEYTTHLYNQVYNPSSTLYRDDSGNLYAGGNNGLAIVREASLRSDVAMEGLAFDKLLVLNREVRANDPSGLLTDILARTSDLHLSHRQNNITIEFADFNYYGKQHVLFEYRMEGYDPVWTQTVGPFITYTNLPAGDYTLRLRRMGQGDEAQTIALGVHVAAPFYATGWAYLLYLLVLATLAALFYRFRQRQVRLRYSLEVERQEKDRVEQLSHSKQVFFTNISHEFRTPLTLIIGQLESLLHSVKLDTPIQSRVMRIYRNAWQMRELVSELLTFRKQEEGYLKLKAEETDLVTFVHQIFLQFQELAQQKNIRYHFYSEVEALPVWIDRAQIQKVVFNLLSNAFKFTPTGGSVTIDVRQIAGNAVVQVRDTGTGISPEEQTHIFDPFYQADNQHSGYASGFGIGLALTKGLMDLHHGSIDIASNVGEGSLFTLTFLPGNSHFRRDELSTRKEETLLIPDSPIFYEEPADNNNESPLPTPEEMGTEKSVVLLVDDSQEILRMLTDLLGNRYELHTATNGEEALAKATELQPDLIVSDVMMPGLSGKELCYKIKSSVELSHILVVLLTAQSDPDQIVEGLMFGADAYLSKPFSSKILLARLDSLIKNKKRLLAYYSGRPMVDNQPDNAVASEADRKFLENCDQIIRRHFADASFNVLTLSEEVFISKSKLYTQLKRLSGLTPNEYILRLKMNEAMKYLMERPELSVAEVSTLLGFSSPRYFSASFKVFFGMTPAGLKKKNSMASS
jgi:signal transduction histidine kinase/ligand-binding sensor domain-containing protein/DNA-binding response OmpR family regulator